MRIERVGDVQCELGEGPVWDVAEQALYFTDMTAGRIWRYDPQADSFTNWKTPGLIGSFALREGGGAVMALTHGFHLLDFATGETTRIAEPEAGQDAIQFNDGKADKRGRFLAGTVNKAMKEPVGSLYRLDPDKMVVKLDDGFIITNGPCWSPDGETFYFADSMAFEIYAYDYDVETGGVSNRRVFANTRALGGIPDGATVDADGRLWSAICGGGKVVAYRPDGAVDRIIEVPPRLASSVMFGGRDLDQLYVTSIDGATMGQARDAAGGQLFVITGLGVKGLPEHRYAG